MLLVNVHQLDIVFTNPVALRTLKHQVDDVRRVLCFECENIIALGGAQHFCKGVEVDAKGDVAVAAERAESVGREEHANEGDVGVVHGLECNAGVIAIEIAVLHKVFDGIDNLATR